MPDTKIRANNIDALESRHSLGYPYHLSRAIIFYFLVHQVLSFVADSIPLASAFVPRSRHVPTETIPSFGRTTVPLQTATALPRTLTRTTPSITQSTPSAATSTSLFGIKGFRAWFQSQFPNAVRNVDVSQHQDTFDHVLIDMNQILHVILRRSKNTEQATKLLMVELDTLIQRCQPVHSLVLAIDGSPASAKVATQRKRRFSILKNTKFKLKHVGKLRMSKRRRERRLRNYKSELRSLQLSPGTECMKSMESAILYWAWQRLQSQGKPYSRLLPRVRIYVSSSLVPGEGEIKLLEWINNYRGHLSRNPGQSIALIGGDADLLLEAMVIPPSWTHNVFVLRPEEAMNPNNKGNDNNSSSPNNSSPPKTKRFRKKIMHCTSLWEMTLSLDDHCRKSIPKEYYNPEENPEDQNLLLQIRTDMVLLLMLNGNDYLPRVVAVGFRGVLMSYLALLEEWIKRKGTSQNVGLVDPNTLNFRSDFCADFFHILGRNAPSTRERNRSVKNSTQKTYQSMLNDMSAIGFIPTPLKFRIVGDGSNDEKGIDEVDVQDQEIEAEDDLYDEDDDEEDDDDQEDLEGDAKPHSDAEMQLVLGKKNEDDYYEYSVRVNTKSSKSIKKGKGALSKMVLEEFDLLEYIDGADNIEGKDYEWEIEVPAPANIGRYLAGLIWTLQTYQDGVCPTYHYNYGKCLAPTGREIASYFVTAMDENRDVGAAELLGDFKPGGSVSAGVACLAALPISVKHLVPKPYSLIADDDVEEFYSQCMNHTDNFFHMKKFEGLVEAEIERFGKLNVTKEQRMDSSRDIILGNHHWTVLKREKDPVQNPFKPPPPPAENFSMLRSDSRIKASRIISMDLPSPRNSINYTVPDFYSSKSNYPRKFWDKNNIEIDHLNFGSLINGSRSSILETPYKIAFGSSPDVYGGSQETKDKTSFTLLKTKSVDMSKYEISDYNGQRGKAKFGRIPIPRKANSDNLSALAVFKQLHDIHLVGEYSFTLSLSGEVVLSVLFGAKGSLPLEDMSFSHLRHYDDSLAITKQYLASLALDAIMYPRRTDDNESENERTKRQNVQWYDLSFKGMKDLLKRHSTEQLVNHNSLVILKQLSDVGMVSYEFNETPASADYPEMFSLSVCMGSLSKQGKSSISSSQTVAPTRPETLVFERYRRKNSKKLTKQQLASLALDTMIAEGNNSTVTHWYDISFKDVKDRVERRLHC